MVKKESFKTLFNIKKMAFPIGIEPTTYRLGGDRSILLSYGNTNNNHLIIVIISFYLLFFITTIDLFSILKQYGLPPFLEKMDTFWTLHS